MSTPAPRHPFRVTRPHDGGPPLSPQQKRTLAALVAVCPTAGSDCDARAVARPAGLRLNAVVVILHSLVDKRLVTRYEEAEGLFWAPTMTGRARVRVLPSDGADGGPAAPPAGPAV